MSTFVFKSAVLIITYRDAGHAPTEVMNIILSYTSITQIMVDSHCEYCGLTTLEHTWGATPQQITQHNYMTHTFADSNLSIAP